ncbi:Z1 domain-containing protein [Nocardia huaxiensis]|uniref:Z1 domain-containing protein n=1 Tax=Nocardia huaxiensis TaxID=2755382 RepID=UPI001E2C863C|nr:Z1 domain-containing protein [Nocardia huaxiensis]UFS96410.1 Z1 domain-containing protein [Nocardia huaxiensis]
MPEPDDDLYDIFEALLDRFTPENAIKRLAALASPEDVQRIRDRHEQTLIRIREMEEPRALILGNRITWYTGPQPGDKYWPALKNVLARDGWAQGAIENLDESSTRIVSLLNHPREKQFSARGLVVGYVQSGKTTSFTAVTAKAADRGYKLFIVLAGIHNGLRRQTQARLIKQLVEPNPGGWSQITDLDHDFTPTANPASFFSKANSTHVLCVVKKNATVLRKLVKWLNDASEYLVDTPAVIIDDEADQATVATKSINPLIRKVLDSLPKSAYVGYTASPFANLLIDPSADDLYPKDFIVNLPKPDGHFGTEVLFGRYALDGENPEDVDDGFDMIRKIPDEDVPLVRPKTRADAEGFQPELTDSLRRAVTYFWLGTAARRVRGSGNPHSTMLIHTSVRTSVHNSFRDPLEGLRDLTARRLDQPATIAELRKLWDEETARVSAEDFNEAKVEFEELLPELAGVLRDCRVIMDNSGSTERLDYENGPVVAIAVGGNTLSRGLTLEGLLVSYFVRAVTVYDTLLQMGRWFGYRNGYADLPRIWMTEELVDWFRHLATVEVEMRRDIDIYLTEDKTPTTFAVRLRTHPALKVTAAAKMADAVRAHAGYGGKRVQTRYFHTNPEWLHANQEAARALVGQAVSIGARVEKRSDDGVFVLREVPSDLVVEFLQTYRFHEKSQEVDPDLMVRYIERRIRNTGALRRWNVAVIGNAAGIPEENFAFADGIAVKRVIRSRLDTSEPDFADIKTLMSRKDAAIDLDGDIAGLTEQQIFAERRKQLPDTGLLVLYPIDKTSEPSPGRVKRAPLDASDHVIGAGLVFPKPSGDDDVVAYEAHYISADLSGIEMEEEDLSILEAEDQ